MSSNEALAGLGTVAAAQLKVSQYLNIASLAAFVWDALLHAEQDYELFFRRRWGIPTLAYLLSRLTTLLYIVTVAAYQIGEVSDCQNVLVVIGVTFAVAIPATSYLFLLRVCAVFSRDRALYWGFRLLWVAVVGASLTAPFAITGAHIEDTLYCMDMIVKPFISSGIIVSTINDTIVFLAISYRLLDNPAVRNSFGERLRAFFGRRTPYPLPSLSKGLLHSGQSYYMIAVAGNISSMALILSPSIPSSLRCLLPVPNLTITNAMACKVFRDMKLGLIDANPAAADLSSLSYSTSPSAFYYHDSGFESKGSGPTNSEPQRAETAGALQLKVLVRSECSMSTHQERNGPAENA